jgi:mannose-binding lectin 2
MGWLWSRLPVTAANFEIEVEFKINSESTHLYGDGLAIWLTTTRAQPGPVFGSVGEQDALPLIQCSNTHADEFNGLAIFLDTYV